MIMFSAHMDTHGAVIIVRNEGELIIVLVRQAVHKTLERGLL